MFCWHYWPLLLLLLKPKSATVFQIQNSVNFPFPKFVFTIQPKLLTQELTNQNAWLNCSAFIGQRESTVQSVCSVAWESIYREIIAQLFLMKYHLWRNYATFGSKEMPWPAVTSLSSFMKQKFWRVRMNSFHIFHCFLEVFLTPLCRSILQNFRLSKNCAKNWYIKWTKSRDKLCILFYTKGVTPFLRNWDTLNL